MDVMHIGDALQFPNGGDRCGQIEVLGCALQQDVQRFAQDAP